MSIITVSNSLNWIKLSRPRFWLYLLGPYGIGLAASITNVSDWWRLDIWLWFAFFLIPANFYLYGINDLADFDTDTFNQQKKGVQEIALPASYKAKLSRILFAVLVLSLVLAFATLRFLPIVYLFCFLALATMYSLTPFRFKSRPIIDFVSNVLYILPAGVAFAMITHQPLPPMSLLAGGFWCASMHLFSAIPDISADRRAGLRTSAVVLGQNKSLLLASFMWLVSGLLAVSLLGSIGLLSFVYCFIPLFLLGKSASTIRRAYWCFPLLNAIFGFGLFWLVVLR